MENTTLKFLEILKYAIHGETISNNDISKALDWNKLFEMAKVHNVIPLVYEGCCELDCFEDNNDILFAQVEQGTMYQVMTQVRKTSDFLDIYNKIRNANIDVILFKGLVCRNTYPNPDSRLSGDEDVLIHHEDFEVCHKILLDNNFRVYKDEDNIPNLEVVTYKSSTTNLYIDLHKTLFTESEENYTNRFNKYFEDVFKDCITLNIDGSDVLTFDYTTNLMYLITHIAKHFLHGGIGIRQVCDIIKFVETYSDNIDWNTLWTSLKEIKFDYFVFNLLKIGEVYLGLDTSKVHYKYKYDYNEADCIDLLNDIIDAGVFGQSTIERKRSSLITLNAMKDDKSKNNFIAAAFPKAKELEYRYKYLKKFPYFLPIAWINRGMVYLFNDNKDNSSSKEIVSIGTQRVELLKKYKII